MTRRKPPTGTPANDAKHPDGDRDPHPEAVQFKLYNWALPLELLVEVVESEADAVGLSGKDIHRTAGDLLHFAGFYTEDEMDNYLYIKVSIAGPAFCIELRLLKEMFDPASKLLGIGASWHDTIIGTHNNEGARILSVLKALMEDFISEYRRANGRPE